MRWRWRASEQKRSDGDVLHKIETLSTGSVPAEETGEAKMLRNKAITFPNASTY